MGLQELCRDSSRLLSYWYNSVKLYRLSIVIKNGESTQTNCVIDKSTTSLPAMKGDPRGGSGTWKGGKAELADE